MAAGSSEAGAGGKTDVATLLARVAALRQAADAAKAVAAEKTQDLVNAEAKAKQAKAEADARAKAKAEAEQAKAEADTRAKAEAADKLVRARADATAKAEAEAKQKAKAEAEQAKAEADTRAKAEAAARLVKARADAGAKAGGETKQAPAGTIAGSVTVTPYVDVGTTPINTMAGTAAAAAAGDQRQVWQQWLSMEQQEAASGTGNGNHPRQFMAAHDAAASLPWTTDGFPIPPRKLGTAVGYRHLVWQAFVDEMPSLHRLMACQNVQDLLGLLSKAQRVCNRSSVGKTLWELLPPECKPDHAHSDHPIVIRLGHITNGPKSVDTLVKHRLPNMGIKDVVVIQQPNLFGDVMYVDLLFKLADIRLAGTVVHTFHGKWSLWSELESHDALFRMIHICLPQVCALFPCMADPIDSAHCLPHHLCQAMYYIYSHAWDDVCEEPRQAADPSESSTRAPITVLPEFTPANAPEYNEDSGDDNPWAEL